MCNSCGYNNCSCTEPTYTYNWHPVDNYPCNPCSVTPVCKKKIPAACVTYNGPNFTTLNVATNTSIEDVIQSFAVSLQALKTTHDAKIVNIQSALNSINARINALSGGTPVANYII